MSNDLWKPLPQYTEERGQELATNLEIEFSDAMSFGVRTVVKVRLGCVTEGKGRVSGEGITDPPVPSIPTQTPGPHILNTHLDLFFQ